MALYATVYALLSKKFNWLICVAGGWITYFGATLFLIQLDSSLLTTFLVSTLVLAVLLVFFPEYKLLAVAIKAPKWDIPLRIILATLFVIGLTYISADLGPQLSGLLTPFPIFGTIFAATTHYLYGSDACVRLLRGVVISMFSFSAFFAVIAGYIQPLSVVQTFCLATFSCLLVQSVMIYIDRCFKKYRK